MLMPPIQTWDAIQKIHPPLGEGTDDHEQVKRGWMQAHILSENLARMTLLDRFNIIFKNRWPKIIGSQNLLGCRKPQYMTTTNPIVTIINNGLILLVIQATNQDIIYASVIQSVVDDKVVLSLIPYTLLIVSQKVLRELQSFKIDQNVSMPGV
jgi:hypothetical protein